MKSFIAVLAFAAMFGGTAVAPHALTSVIAVHGPSDPEPDTSGSPIGTDPEPCPNNPHMCSR